MKLTFCGGAREVGASCYLLKIDDKNILLDCGIRMKGSDNLPDFRLIQEAGGVDAIIVSHAHLDHSGALPVISREYPEARIYMTHASKALLRVLLYDSLKIMERDEADIPIYAEKHVVEMLDRVICYSPQYSFKPIPGIDIKVTFYNAGHIAGAALIYLQANEGTMLFTGDYSVTDQKTVIGCSVPRLRPDVMISEATYGDKLHSNRKIEEERLVSAVKEVIERKGKILIPAFALGRAQEIILILRKAINKQEIPEFKIYIDGMIRAVNRIYKLNPNYLQSNLARKIFRGTDIFYDDNILEVMDHDMREEIVDSDEPLCIISSSGMLKGGPSSYYAEKLLDDEKNFIAITGYQDEEAPGRDILDLLESDEEKREFIINNKHLEVKCQLGKYGLSAHADKGELLGLIHRVSPRRIFLVHGNQEVINQLALEMNQDVRGRVFVPENGEDFSFAFRNPRKQLDFDKDIESLNSKEELNEDNIEKLWRHIYQKKGTEIGFSVEEMIYLQEGNNIYKNRFSANDSLSSKESKKIERYQRILNESKYFTPNRRRLFLYHPVAEEELAEDDGIMEMNEMFSVVDTIFPPEAGLYKRGARIENNIVLLNFNFPTIAEKKYSKEIEELKVRTGWEVEINEDCNLMALEELVYKLIPAEIDVRKISYYREKGSCELSLDAKALTLGENTLEEIINEFVAISGVELIISTPEGEIGDSKDSIALKEIDENKMMEQNQAFSYIDDAFIALDVKIYKKSRKVANGIPYIEIYFISPEFGERYQDVVKELEEDTGWNIRIGRTPIQNEIIKIVKRMAIKYDINLKKNPGLYADKAEIKLIIEDELDADKFAEFKNKIKDMTAYEIVLA
ncbi:MAG: MBL fold metallo-hydrolase [Halanaerobiales bacterium]